MNPNHISLFPSLNYYVDTSKFILVSQSRVRGPFLFFLGQVQNWSGPHSVFKCIIHVCAHTHTTFSDGSLAVRMSGMVCPPSVSSLSPGKKPWLSLRRSRAVSLQRVNSKNALLFSQWDTKTTFIRINSGAYLKCRFSDHKTDPLNQNY